MSLPLCCPDYSLFSRLVKRVNISIKTPTRGEISHLVIDSTGLKVFGEGEWKVKQHGADRRRVWCKLYLAADSATHEIICADLSLSGTADAQAPTALINQTHRKIREVSADGAYDARYGHDALLRKKIRPLIPPRSGAKYWPDKYHERNHAVANQRRSELLTLLDIPFERLRVDVIEQQAAHETAAVYVRRLAQDKAQGGVAAAPQDLPVLGADTIVVPEGQGLEKPLDEAHAAHILSMLSGRQH